MVYYDSLGYKPRRNRSCFVYGCFSTAANKPKLGFHKFPIRGKRNIVVTKKNGDKCIYDRRQLWIEALNIGKGAALALDRVTVYVCSLHFARDDFYYNQDITGRRYLKEFAVPRRNLPPRTTSPLTTKFSLRSLHRVTQRGYFNIHNPDGRKLTAPRSSLGTTSTNPSYTKTVWVVRKPAPNKQQNVQTNSAEDETNNVVVAHTFSLQNNEEKAIDNDNEEARDDEHCTIIEDGSNTQPSNPWFTSELIIKEEPISDCEQEPADGVLQRSVDAGQVFETNIEDDENDVSYEPNKLVIQSEDEEEEPINSLSKEDNLESEEVNEQYESEVGEIEELEDIADEFDLSNAEEPEITILEGEDQEEYYDDYESSSAYDGGQVENGNDDVTEVHMEGSEEYEEYHGQAVCHVCGVENCENHPGLDDQENYFVCLVCSEIFPSQLKLAIHSRTHEDLSDDEALLLEERTKSLTCEFCGRVLSTKSTLREHIMIHTGEKPHKCLLCGKSFRHKANLVVHVNGHAIVSTYKCKKCNKAFTKKMDFENHLQYHVDASGNPLVCKICNAVFKSQRTLYNHSQLHSRNGLVRLKKRNGQAKNPQFVCNICGRALSTKATLKEHKMIHTGEKPHVCKICGRTIRHKANFIVHVQTHGQGKSFECDMCDEAFMRKSDLTQHKQLQHSKSKLLRCPICSEVFKSPQKFNRHMEIHESVVYMNETEEINEFEPHILESFFEG